MITHHDNVVLFSFCAVFIAFYLGKFLAGKATKARLEREYELKTKSVDRNYEETKSQLEHEYELKTRSVDRNYREKNQRLEAQYQAKQKENTDRGHYLNEQEAAFNKGFLTGRHWLAGQFAELKRAADERESNRLTFKKHPAPTAADVVKTAKLERREALKRITFLEYQLKSYEEYLPFLEEYRDVILDERVLSRGK